MARPRDLKFCHPYFQNASAPRFPTNTPIRDVIPILPTLKRATMQMTDPPTLMSNFMALALTVLQSILAVPESMINAFPYDALKEGIWNEAWERVLKALASFDEPYLALYSVHDIKPVNDDTSKVSRSFMLSFILVLTAHSIRMMHLSHKPACQSRTIRHSHRSRYRM